MTYEYFDYEGLLLRTPVAAYEYARGFEGFEQLTAGGWKRNVFAHADIMRKAYPIEEHEAKAMAEGDGMSWV